MHHSTVHNSLNFMNENGTRIYEWKNNEKKKTEWNDPYIHSYNVKL